MTLLDNRSELDKERQHLTHSLKEKKKQEGSSGTTNQDVPRPQQTANASGGERYCRKDACVEGGDHHSIPIIQPCSQCSRKPRWRPVRGRKNDARGEVGEALSSPREGEGHQGPGQR